MWQHGLRQGLHHCGENEEFNAAAQFIAKKAFS